MQLAAWYTKKNLDSYFSVGKDRTLSREKKVSESPAILTERKSWQKKLSS